MASLLAGKRHQPKRLTLSPTRISTYLACRVLYKYTYIDRIGRFYYRPKAYHSFGASLHRTLEDFHKSGGAETQSSEELVGKLHEVWTSLGYASCEEENARFQAASEYLEQYHTQHQVAGVKTLFTEKQLRWDMGEFDLMGRLDRLDEHPDGRIELIDYKSGRLCVTGDEMRNDLAMGIYAYLTSRNYPGRKITASIYCLRTGDRAAAEFSDEEIMQIEDGVRTVAAEIMSTDEDSVVEPAWLSHVCPECDCLRLCARRMHWDVEKLTKESMDADEGNT